MVYKYYMRLRLLLTLFLWLLLPSVAQAHDIEYGTQQQIWHPNENDMPRDLSYDKNGKYMWHDHVEDKCDLDEKYVLQNLSSYNDDINSHNKDVADLWQCVNLVQANFVIEYMKKDPPQLGDLKTYDNVYDYFLSELISYNKSEDLLDMIKLLVAAGANPNYRSYHWDGKDKKSTSSALNDYIGRSDYIQKHPFHQHLKILDYMLANGADINAPHEWMKTPLSRYADGWVNGKFNWRIIKDLLERGANPNIGTHKEFAFRFKETEEEYFKAYLKEHNIDFKAKEFYYPIDFLHISMQVKKSPKVRLRYNLNYNLKEEKFYYEKIKKLLLDAMEKHPIVKQ